MGQRHEEKFATLLELTHSKKFSSGLVIYYDYICLQTDVVKSLYSKMFNPNLQKKQVTLHELYTYYISYKGI